MAGSRPARLYCHARLRAAAPQLNEARASETQLNEIRSSETLTADLWVSEESGQLLGRIVGLVLKRASRQSLLAAAGNSIADWLYEVEWQERPHATAVADFFPAVPALAAAVRSAAPELLAVAGLAASDGQALLAGLEQLSCQYMVRALERLGWTAVPGEAFDTDRLLGELRILPAYRRLLERIRAVLSQAGLLAHDGQQWRVARPWPAVDPAQLAQELLERHPHSEVELHLLGRCGANWPRCSAGRSSRWGCCSPQQARGPRPCIATRR